MYICLLILNYHNRKIKPNSHHDVQGFFVFIYSCKKAVFLVLYKSIVIGLIV